VQGTLTRRRHGLAMSRRGESVGVVVTERSRVIVVSRDRNCFARAQKACGTNDRKDSGDVFHNISFVSLGSCKSMTAGPLEFLSDLGPMCEDRRSALTETAVCGQHQRL